jgi:small neutral amino acid transporter SnatA (MarC family)
MKFGAVDIFTILLITIGPLKGMIVFAALTAQADPGFRRKVAMRAVATATGIVLLFIVAGELMLQIFHVTLPALKIAGGIILLLVALHMVMGEMGNEGKDMGTALITALTIVRTQTNAVQLGMTGGLPEGNLRLTASLRPPGSGPDRHDESGPS